MILELYNHINGGGTAERKHFKDLRRYYRYILEQIEQGSKDYRCLCANCNSIEYYSGGESVFKVVS